MQSNTVNFNSKCCLTLLTMIWPLIHFLPNSPSGCLPSSPSHCSFHALLSSTLQEAFQIGIYWADTNTVHKSTALKLVHDLTSPRWKEGSGSEVVTLDEEGYVEADITLGAFPGRQKVRETTVKLLQHTVTTLHSMSLNLERCTRQGEWSKLLNSQASSSPDTF